MSAIQVTNPITGYTNAERSDWFCWDHREARPPGYDYPVTDKSKPAKPCFKCALDDAVPPHGRGCWREHPACATELLCDVRDIATLGQGEPAKRLAHILKIIGDNNG